MKHLVEKDLGKEQAMYRSAKQTIGNIYNIENIIERRKGNGEKLLLAFIDLRGAKANIIWKCLQEIKTPIKRMQVINKKCI